jgi:hypothetical protein
MKSGFASRLGRSEGPSKVDDLIIAKGAGWGCFHAGVGIVLVSSFIGHERPAADQSIQLFEEELPIAGDARSEVSTPFAFPFPSTDDAPSSSYKPWASMYSITGAGIKYCTLISLLKNILIFVELTSF